MSEVRWEDFGPAEFDRRRMPRGHKIAPKDQGGLFVMAVEPRPVKAPALPPELPGQLSILDAE
jgi:hypothetical protein